ncbi:unnamed protein product [Schistocephalus solidus]|uniref:Uncharacterized protein n=1 Tax=Schistocephalus solidus TaxID=70667 RepID=A0A183STU4_SCHSO|nr:unnamed protein product [Schistocephalus solidus]
MGSLTEEDVPRWHDFVVVRRVGGGGGSGGGSCGGGGGSGGGGGGAQCEAGVKSETMGLSDYFYPVAGMEDDWQKRPFQLHSLELQPTTIRTLPGVLAQRLDTSRSVNSAAHGSPSADIATV